MKYYDTKRNITMTEHDLRSMGIYDTESAKRVGIYPLKQELQLYDPDIRKLVEKGTPELVGDYCIQRYELVELNEEEMLQSLDNVSKRTLLMIRSLSDSTLRPFLEDYSETEKMTFDLQAQEVYNYQNDPEAAKTPIIDGLADARGISREELIQKARVKIDLFQRAFTYVIGTQQKYEDTVKSIMESEITPKEKILALKDINIEYVVPSL